MRESISFEQVAAIAERLTASGKGPTLRNVRAALGTGSMSTIRNFIERWRKQRPTETTKAPYQLSTQVLDQLHLEIDRQVAERSNLLEAQLKELRDELEAVSAESEQRALRIEALEAELADRKQRLDRFHALEEELEQAKHEAEAARREAAITASSVKRLVQAENDMEQLRTELRTSERDFNARLLVAETRAARAEGELAGRALQGPSS